ncbi:thioredoxin domain-containing protein [Corticicoccus populi]|uniref:Thioredoxin domain-containing protein n=1 Tax=Corticicoccus populi TaxID=1812821 RepID=A0ABW5WYX8_9STAP
MTEEVKHLVLGSSEAEVEIESYINLGCPYCTAYINAVDDLFQRYIDDGKVRHVIKHFDKTRSGLLKGTVANAYLDVGEPEAAYENIKTLLNTREDWTQSFHHTLEKAAGELGLHEQHEAGARSVEILNETKERDIKVVPTVFVNGRRVDFDGNYEEDALVRSFKEIIDAALI